ncbi:MAG: ABC transporter substrate-binding protein [Campylobacterota bacterium]|nr:ABC transporter substrate-binding protein [Campylobacterota bacterium]
MRLLFILFLTFFILGCNDAKDQPLKIGFVAGLSGKYSQLGTSVRNGVTLAFSQINYTINNQKIDLQIHDDKQNPKEAKKAIDQFLQNDIKLIIGNATSSMTKISLNSIKDKKDTTLFSATASSNIFTAIDDNFIRTQVDHTKTKYKNLSNYLRQKNYKNIFFIYDPDNQSYVKDYEETFQDVFIEHGGNKFVHSIGINEPHDAITEKIQQSNADLILIVANSIDTAQIVQYLKVNNVHTKILSSGWAKTLDLIQNGGSAVEGMLFNTGYDDNASNPEFIQFKKDFYAHFKKEPSIFAAQGYELAQIVLKVLQSSSDLTQFKQQVLKIKTFSGLQGDIVFNQYGDVSRDYFLVEIKNKKFIRVQ